mmetsp:Transcript_47422/g.121045  ORF Transcript_47422/g.121045 Transcript_47422/m.121045 type:complete len:177 (-) Transcript_47422:329-859(-)|eukprot:jgi/Tetstr1/429037/TSEL_019002.t1
MEPRTPVALPAQDADVPTIMTCTPVVVTSTAQLVTPVRPSPCPVCLSPLVLSGQRREVAAVGATSARKEVFVTECGHRFHLPCLGQWVATQCEDSCPNCRSALHSQTTEALRQFVPVGGLNPAPGATVAGDHSSTAAAMSMHRNQVIVNRSASAREAVRRRMLAAQQQQQPLLLSS